MNDFSVSSSTVFDSSEFESSDVSFSNKPSALDFEISSELPDASSFDMPADSDESYYFDQSFGADGQTLSGLEFDIDESSDVVVQATDTGSEEEEPYVTFGTAAVIGGVSTPVGSAWGILPRKGDSLRVDEGSFFVASTLGPVATFKPNDGAASVGGGAAISVPGTSFTGFLNSRLEFSKLIDNPFDGETTPGDDPRYLYIGDRYRLMFDNPLDRNGAKLELPELSVNGGFFVPGAQGTGVGVAATVKLNLEKVLDKLGDLRRESTWLP